MPALPVYHSNGWPPLDSATERQVQLENGNRMHRAAPAPLLIRRADRPEVSLRDRELPARSSC